MSAERNVFRACCILLLTFVFSWIPFLSVCVIDLLHSPVNSYAVIICIFISKISCIHSSYAYATHRHFRATLIVVKSGLSEALSRILMTKPQDHSGTMAVDTNGGPITRV